MIRASASAIAISVSFGLHIAQRYRYSSSLNQLLYNCSWIFYVIRFCHKLIIWMHSSDISSTKILFIYISLFCYLLFLLPPHPIHRCLIMDISLSYALTLFSLFIPIKSVAHSVNCSLCLASAFNNQWHILYILNVRLLKLWLWQQS